MSGCVCECERTIGLQLLHSVLIDGVDEVEDLEVLLLERLEEGRVLDGRLRLAGDVVDRLLAGLHAADVLLQRRQLSGSLGRRVAQQIGELGAVGRVLVDSELEVLGERL